MRLRDYCLEGTCEMCLVEGSGLKETSWKADPTGETERLEISVRDVDRWGCGAFVFDAVSGRGIRDSDQGIER